MLHEAHKNLLHPLLAKPDLWAQPVLRCSDEDNALALHACEAFHYHGFDAPGGVALGFRLLQKAFACLAPAEPYPARKELSLFTSFPGLGLKDTMEAASRMVSEGRYHVDPNHHDGRAQEGICGDFYFRFAYRGRVVELAPVEGYPGNAFIHLGRASKQTGFTPEQAFAWKNAKFGLANTLLTSTADAVIRVL